MFASFVRSIRTRTALRTAATALFAVGSIPSAMAASLPSDWWGWLDGLPGFFGW